MSCVWICIVILFQMFGNYHHVFVGVDVSASRRDFATGLCRSRRLGAHVDVLPVRGMLVICPSGECLANIITFLWVSMYLHLVATSQRVYVEAADLEPMSLFCPSGECFTEVATISIFQMSSFNTSVAKFMCRHSKIRKYQHNRS